MACTTEIAHNPMSAVAHPGDGLRSTCPNMSSSGPRRLTIGSIGTPIGDLLLVADVDGKLTAAEFTDADARLHAFLDRRFGRHGHALAPGPVASDATAALAAYFIGDLDPIARLDVRLAGTAFQVAAWQELRRIEPAHPLSYGELARRLGRPSAARAVGHANAANPLSIIVPCHRLIGRSGHLTGYGGGIERKRWLLDHEARHAAVHRRPVPSDG